MPRQLVALKVVIEDGKTFKYPDFNALAVVQSWSAQNGGDWSNYIDVEGLGWKYDNAGDFAKDDGETPQGQWCALLLVNSVFADEAIAIYPDKVTRLTEAQCKSFYDDRHAIEFPDEDIDNDILQGIKLKQDLNLSLTPDQAKAIDPTDSTRGITKSKNKKWVDFKLDKDIQIVP